MAVGGKSRKVKEVVDKMYVDKMSTYLHTYLPTCRLNIRIRINVVPARPKLGKASKA
jgi:hypothetical protein